MARFTGKLVTRPFNLTLLHGSNDRHTLNIADRNSGLMLLRIDLTDEQFINLLTNRQAVSDGLYNTNPNIGKFHQNKQEWVSLAGEPPGYSSDNWQEFLREAVKPFEVDGWKADIDETRNSLRVNSQNQTYSVTFRRYVDNPQENVV
jgi:hypothetical protein